MALGICKKTDEICFWVTDDVTLCKYLAADIDPEACPYGEGCARLTTANTTTDFCMSCNQSEYLNGLNGLRYRMVAR